MIFHPTPIHGAYLVEMEPRVDDRGSFARAFCLREFENHGISFHLAQANLACTREPGTVRGLHFQVPPAAEQKLVRCIAGAVHDVIIDVRPDSPTRLAVYQVRLDAMNRLALFIPGGVAHGYQTLLPDTQFFYMTDQFYTPGLERGVRHDDPLLKVDWPLLPRNVTDRDRAWPDLVH